MFIRVISKHGTRLSETNVHLVTYFVVSRLIRLSLTSNYKKRVTLLPFFIQMVPKISNSVKLLQSLLRTRKISPHSKTIQVKLPLHQLLQHLSQLPRQHQSPLLPLSQPLNRPPLLEVEIKFLSVLSPKNSLKKRVFP